MRLIVFIVISISLFALLFGVIYYNTGQHEAVHQEIFKSYGIDSEIKINDPITAFRNGGIFGTTTTINYSGQCNETCKSLGLQNEIMGYNMEVIVIAMFSLSFVLLIIFALKDDERRDN